MDNLPFPRGRPGAANNHFIIPNLLLTYPDADLEKAFTLVFNAQRVGADAQFAPVAILLTSFVPIAKAMHTLPAVSAFIGSTVALFVIYLMAKRKTEWYLEHRCAIVVAVKSIRMALITWMFTQHMEDLVPIASVFSFQGQFPTILRIAVMLLACTGFRLPAKYSIPFQVMVLLVCTSIMTTARCTAECDVPAVSEEYIWINSWLRNAATRGFPLFPASDSSSTSIVDDPSAALRSCWTFSMILQGVFGFFIPLALTLPEEETARLELLAVVGRGTPLIPGVTHLMLFNLALIFPATAVMFLLFVRVARFLF